MSVTVWCRLRPIAVDDLRNVCSLHAQKIRIAHDNFQDCRNHFIACTTSLSCTYARPFHVLSCQLPLCVVYFEQREGTVKVIDKKREIFEYASYGRRPSNSKTQDFFCHQNKWVVIPVVAIVCLVSTNLLASLTNKALCLLGPLPDERLLATQEIQRNVQVKLQRQPRPPDQGHLYATMNVDEVYPGPRPLVWPKKTRAKRASKLNNCNRLE